MVRALTAKMLRFVMIMLLTSMSGQYLAAQNNETDPFAAYLKSIPPILKTISSDTVGSDQSAIVTRKMLIGSRDQTNSLYAIISGPAGQGTYPAILILHGGGGNGQGLQPLVESYAKRGYVALTLDIPGICGLDNTPRSTGPWKSKPWGEAPRFDVSADPKNSTLADAGIAGLEAFNLLASQPQVDKSRIGITGFSWGGYATTLLAGLLGDRVKAAYSVWGSGFYEKGSFWQQIIADLPEKDREIWLATFDAGRRAQHIKASYFVEAAANDTYFWPDAVGATLDAIPGDKGHVWGPNINHKRIPQGEKMQEVFFDYHLKKEGKAFGNVNIPAVKDNSDGSKTITVKVKIPAGIVADTVKLYYSKTGKDWISRKWLSIDGNPGKRNRYSFQIPSNIAAKKTDYFIYVADSRGVKISGEMYSTWSKVTSYILIPN